MQASKIVTTASILTLEGLLESRWSLVAAVKFCSRELDLTDTDVLCSLAATKRKSKISCRTVVSLWFPCLVRATLAWMPKIKLVPKIGFRAWRESVL